MFQGSYAAGFLAAAGLISRREATMEPPRKSVEDAPVTPGTKRILVWPAPKVTEDIPVAARRVPPRHKSTKSIPAPKNSRSRITNGAGTLLPGVDGNSALYRRFKDICKQIIADQAGLSECSEARLQLIRRFAASAVLAEELEGALVRGESIDIIKHSLLCSTLTRLAQRIGIDRRSRLVGSTLSDYLHEAETVEGSSS
jgi:hypothetical protein